jgi:hypothetical protein
VHIQTLSRFLETFRCGFEVCFLLPFLFRQSGEHLSDFRRKGRVILHLSVKGLQATVPFHDEGYHVV